MTVFAFLALLQHFLTLCPASFFKHTFAFFTSFVLFTCFVSKHREVKNNPPVTANKVNVFMLSDMVTLYDEIKHKTLQMNTKKVIFAYFLKQHTG